MSALDDKRARSWLKGALGLSGEDEPFPWQVTLLDRFRAGEVIRAVDIPTGLGKTAVIAIWLVARAVGAPLPRRLVYVVDRRAVVDQATVEAVRIREWVKATPAVALALQLEDEDLPISTLRGQHIDNRTWLDDPSCPAVIVGTVDMVGSRLLFEGYGVSRKMRPYHAGLLGSDALFVVDEAHLVPPFERLLESVVALGNDLGPRADLRSLIPPPSLLSLSATGRDHGERVLRLSDEDLAHPEVGKRLHATKRLVLAPPITAKALPSALAARAWELAQSQAEPIRCIVFCALREHAEKARKDLEALARAAKSKPETELFVGARRVWERMQAATRLEQLGFLAGSERRRDTHAFLFATSAGEVGVDLDADHMVADVVAWERTIQRLGRVNRRGNGSAEVHLLPSDEAVGEYEADAVLEMIGRLPLLEPGVRDASPSALVGVRMAANADAGLRDVERRATTPEPLRPALSRPLVESWAMTSLPEHTGRPEVGPWLRGWVKEDAPQTVVVWRTHVADIARMATREALAAYFEAAPPHLAEQLDTTTAEAADWLITVAKRRTSVQRKGPDTRPSDAEFGAIVLAPDHSLVDTYRLGDLGRMDAKGKRRLERALAGRTVIADASLGGLSETGLLDSSSDEAVPSADAEPPWTRPGRSDVSEDHDQSEEKSDAAATTVGSGPHPPLVPFRVRRRPASDLDADAGAEAPSRGRESNEWRETFRLPFTRTADGDVTAWLVVERWRRDAETEDDRSTSPRLQRLDEHQRWAADRAQRLARRLGLHEDLAKILATAARLHDEGKRAAVWQRAFRAPPGPDAYAKTPGPLNTRLLGGYRHEIGSLPYAERDQEVMGLREPDRELVLHLIAAHHGFARPLLSTAGCEDAPPSVLEARARTIALRFIRMQDRWGPWGLAYLEAVLRAADQQASRANDEQGRDA